MSNTFNPKYDSFETIKGDTMCISLNLYTQKNYFQHTHTHLPCKSTENTGCVSTILKKISFKLLIIY
jgi:hypothetical protein